MKRERLMLAISGLSCGGGGSLTVERALIHAPGVLRAYVNPATEMAYVEYDTEETGAQRLIAAVEKTGFHASRVPEP